MLPMWRRSSSGIIVIVSARVVVVVRQSSSGKRRSSVQDCMVLWVLLFGLAVSCGCLVSWDGSAIGKSKPTRWFMVETRASY